MTSFIQVGRAILKAQDISEREYVRKEREKKRVAKQIELEKIKTSKEKLKIDLVKEEIVIENRMEERRNLRLAFLQKEYKVI